MVKVPILEVQMKQHKPNKEPHEVTPPTFQVSWAGLPSTIGGPGWGPQMYGMGPTRYPAMTIFQPPLHQAIAIPQGLIRRQQQWIK
jgi:hypothetical protein